MTPVRSPARPERHFVDSLATIRLTLARMLVKWLPRCPLCHGCQEATHADVQANPPLPRPGDP